MRINLWYCNHMNMWRWTLIDDRRPITRQESGQRDDLKLAMEDVANTVEYILGDDNGHI
jgi:hypothetical protein